MAADKVRGILLVDAFGDFGHNPLVVTVGCEITAHDPDNVRQVLEPLAHELSVTAETLLAAGLHVTKETVLPTAVAEVGGKQPHDDASIVGILHHLVSEIKVVRAWRREIARLREGSEPRPGLRWIGTEPVFDQVHDDRVEAASLAVLQVVVDFFVGELRR